MQPDPQPHIDWILSKGRHLAMQDMVEILGPRLRAAGMPLMRVRLGMRTTHPLIAAFSVIWERDGAEEKLLTYDHAQITPSIYAGSPMETINTTDTPLRKRLLDPLTEGDHTVFHQMQAKGATDYLGVRLPFAHGGNAIMILVADGPAGFSDADVDCALKIAATLSPVVEAHANHNLATAVASSYLGARTGQKVLDGQITRGDIETIEAAILFSDIRGWTALNAERPARETLQIANTYFEVISDAVDTHDGEILKFMGDGVLALFPSDGSHAGRTQSCRQAIAAAHTAHGIAALAQLPVPFGIGIHYGEVLYGNVGARARIDFTILGQSVNTAARVEACCGRLGETVLVSDTVATHAGTPTRHVSTEMLKGLAAPIALHTPVNS